MRQLLPIPLDHVDPVATHASARREPPAGRPWVAINMVTSVDGATALDGVSGGLGSAADKATFRAIRAIADVVVVAAGTVRAESYGPPRPSQEVQAQRVGRGQRPIPQMAIVSRRLDLDPDARIFTEADEPPLILTVDDAPADAVERLHAVADIHHIGSGTVDLAGALALLGGLGHRVVVAAATASRWATTASPPTWRWPICGSTARCCSLATCGPPVRRDAWARWPSSTVTAA